MYLVNPQSVHGNWGTAMSVTESMAEGVTESVTFLEKAPQEFWYYATVMPLVICMAVQLECRKPDLLTNSRGKASKQETGAERTSQIRDGKKLMAINENCAISACVWKKKN
jgi:hypothetical protein